MNQFDAISNHRLTLDEQISQFGFAVVTIYTDIIRSNNHCTYAYTIGFSNYGCPELVISDSDEDEMMAFFYCAFEEIKNNRKLKSQQTIKCSNTNFKLIEMPLFFKEDFTMLAEDYYEAYAPHLLDFKMLYVSETDKNGLYEDDKPFIRTLYNDIQIYQKKT
jgi:hypothetical protein